MTGDTHPIVFFSPPPRSETEVLRLKRLHDLQVLDTAADPELDAIVAQAAALFGAPIALVSLIDARRQWFKARVGLAASETPRALSFCGHAILSTEPLIVLDSRIDERFAGNPLVTSAPHVIFYLGFPLITRDGHALGTLCVIDSRPRAMVEPLALAAARKLAADVVDRLDPPQPVA